MAVLDALLDGDPDALAIPELAPVIARHRWLGTKKLMLVPTNLIGAESLEAGILGGYAQHVATRPPRWRGSGNTARTPLARTPGQHTPDQSLGAPGSRSAGATVSGPDERTHAAGSATATIPAAPRRRRPSEVINVASSETASAMYRASRVAIRSTSAHARTSRGGSGQRIAPNAASASTRSACPRQLSGSLEAPQRRQNLGVEVGRRRYRVGGRENVRGRPRLRGKSQIRSTTIAASTTTMLNGRRARRPRHAQQRPARARLGPPACAGAEVSHSL